MVERREIRITIDKAGVVTLQPVGATGGRCVDWTAPVEAALGTDVSREYKPEYFETSADEVTTLNERGDA